MRVRKNRIIIIKLWIDLSKLFLLISYKCILILRFNAHHILYCNVLLL